MLATRAILARNFQIIGDRKAPCEQSSQGAFSRAALKISCQDRRVVS
jgi:hypothetical protein